MASKTGSQIIAIEEHYLDPEVSQHSQGRDDSRAPAIVERLLDLAEGRLNDMDEAGIDIQVLSHGAPATQRIPSKPMIDCMKPSKPSRTDFPVLQSYQLMIQKHQRMNWSARSINLALKAR